MTTPELFLILEDRFMKHKHRHLQVSWKDVQSILEENNQLLATIKKMEETGGEPDVVVIEGKRFFVDFAKETPEGRRNCCYDEKARLARKKFPPETSALKLAEEIGINILNENMYKELQKIESFDLKTSSWIETPEAIRSLGGALFGDNRYQTTFIYHNGADSYYGVRGFRGYIAF